MAYRYKKFQIFNKKLPVPKEVLNRIYDNNATIQDFIDYGLSNKIPIECLNSRYRDITKIVGIDKALLLDWECIQGIGSYKVKKWMTENFKPEYSAEEFNVALYNAVRNEYLEELNFWNQTKSLRWGDFLNDLRDRGNNYNYHLERLGNRFAEFAPDLLYTTSFQAAKDLLLNQLSLERYIGIHKEYENVPVNVLRQAFSNDVDKKLFEFLSTYITDNNNFKSDELLFKLAFNSNYGYEYEKYLEILEENPEIDAHTFLEKACLLRIKDQDFLQPSSYYISRYNEGKDKKFTFGQEINLNILPLIDKMPEYKKILSQFLNDEINMEEDPEKYDNVEDFIAYLITNYNLDYSDDLPEKFRNAHSELFLDTNDSLKNSFYNKSLSPEIIKKTPLYPELLKNKNISMGFKDEQMIEFIRDVGNARFIELCLKYGNHLVPVKLENKTQTYEEVIEREIIKKIHNYSYHYGSLKNIASIVKEIPDYFLDDSFPEELRNLFYSKQLTPEIIQNHPEWMQMMGDKELGPGLQWNNNNIINLYKLIGKKDFLTICQNYGKYLSGGGFPYLRLDKNMSKEEILEEIENKIYSYIYTASIPYDEKIPKHFREKYPHLFLPDDTPADIKEKFYNREFSPEDFNKNINILKYFENLDVACYLNSNFSWLIGIFKNVENSNQKKIKISVAYEKINDAKLQKLFKEYIKKNIESFDIDKVDFLADLLFKLSYSNSSEMLTFRAVLAEQLLLSDNPLDKLNQIEEVFLKNNIPVVGKIFSVFQILHPDFSKFNFEEYSKISPVLKSKSERGKKITIFADLLKAAFGSNNRSIKEYMENIEQGNNIFLQISSGNISLDQLDYKNKQILSTFINHLNTLYNNTLSGKKERNILSGNIDQDINQIIHLFSENGNQMYNLPDRIIKMFCHFAGFNTFDQAKEYFIQKPKLTDLKNREASKNITLEVGDLIKGIGRVEYLKTILQNGSVAREFLGFAASSDSTPLDTDLSRILKLGDNLNDTISKTLSNDYGPVWLVLKNNERFTVTRRSSGEANQTIDTTSDLNKLEAFYTGIDGNGHYGIRTGFASSEIDYFITGEHDPRIGLEIAINGFYIPVIDKKGKLIFTAQDYDEIRNKMSGLKYFGTEHYNFSDSLLTSGIEEYANMIQSNENDVSIKRNAINNTISKAINSVGLKLKTVIDGDLTEGSVEFIDTGSTGRGTNVPGDGDFDFMMRLDKKIIANPEKMKMIKETLLKAFDREKTSEITGGGDFRLKKLSIEGLDMPVDIDITFIEKTDKLTYSTDMCLKDRLAAIKEQSPEQYPLVVANILLAKQILKKAEVYKPERSDIPEGGMGGIGIENWILQNGGSFAEAAMNFMNYSTGKTFEEFKQCYSVWDFGENHLASKKGFYPHDDFIKNNMSEKGYRKMNKVLANYLSHAQYQQSDSIHR